MKISSYLLLLLVILLPLKNSLFAEEIRHADFTIIYDNPELKYFAKITKAYLVDGMSQLETTTGLKFKKKILVSIYKNTDALLNQHKIKNSEDVFFRIDTATSINIIITPTVGYYSHLPYAVFVQKKLFYSLFRQNKLPENVWFEEAFFEIVLQEMYGYGMISMGELKRHLPLKIETLVAFKKKEWESARDIPNTPENISLSIEKINMAKTILLNNRSYFCDRDPIKIANYCHLTIKKLKKKESWLKQFNSLPNEDFVNIVSAKRDLYFKMMENFNTPGSGAEQNIAQEYVFRSILRLLVKKHSVLAYLLFKELEITPSMNPYFPELGLFFAKKNQNDTVIWLEYFLINQKEKKPVDFNNSDQVSILLQETFTQEMPDFQINDQELDFIRTLQFLLFLGKNELILDYMNKLKDQPQNIETKNFIWGLGILLNNKKILNDYDENAEFFRSRTWEVIKAIRK